MNYQGQNKSISMVIGFFIGYSPSAYAVCNNVNNWFEAPGQEIKVFVGYSQEQKRGFGVFGVTQSATYHPYPEPLPKDMFGKEGGGSLAKNETSKVSYYESDGKGNWRVCRVDTWWPVGFGDQDAWKLLKPTTARYAANHPVLQKLSQKNVAMFATLYFYDDKGRLVRLDEGEFQKPDKKASIKVCREYIVTTI